MNELERLRGFVEYVKFNKAAVCSCEEDGIAYDDADNIEQFENEAHYSGCVWLHAVRVLQA